MLRYKKCIQSKMPKVMDTVWAGAVQKLVDENGVPKGMKRVLLERRLNTATMVADDMRTVLANHKNFRTEKTLPEHFLTNRKTKVFLIPKFHCEFNAI